jgi:hypothetical protein
MDLKTLQDTPPWDWPTDAANRFQEILINYTQSRLYSV